MIKTEKYKDNAFTKNTRDKFPKCRRPALDYGSRGWFWRQDERTMEETTCCCLPEAVASS